MGRRNRSKRNRSNLDSLNSTTVPMKSGFVVRVKALPPYYKDLLDDTIPLPEYPTRTIILAAGDEIEWPYEPKEEHFDPDHEDYELYVRWKAVDEERNQLTELRKKARRDFLLSNCVDVVEGPYDLDDVEWVQRVEAAFEDWSVPTHPGRKYLIFLLTQVITDAEDMELVMKLSTAAEVSMQGVLNALRSFPVDLGQREIRDSVGYDTEEQSITQSEVD